MRARQTGREPGKEMFEKYTVIKAVISTKSTITTIAQGITLSIL